MATVTLTENEISVTADSMRKAKRLLREALEAAQKRAAEEREKQDFANKSAESRAYNFIRQKHSRDRMPQAWKLLSPDQAIASGDVKLISTEHGNRRFKVITWERGEPQSAEIEIYYRDTLRGFIVGSSGVIGFAIGFYHDENGVCVHGLGIHQGKYNYFQAFGVSPEDFGTPEDCSEQAIAEETAEPQEAQTAPIETWESVEA
jgi:hypothetical protein